MFQRHTDRFLQRVERDHKNTLLALLLHRDTCIILDGSSVPRSGATAVVVANTHSQKAQGSKQQLVSNIVGSCLAIHCACRPGKDETKWKLSILGNLYFASFIYDFHYLL